MCFENYLDFYLLPSLFLCGTSSIILSVSLLLMCGSKMNEVDEQKVIQNLDTLEKWLNLNDRSQRLSALNRIYSKSMIDDILK